MRQYKDIILHGASLFRQLKAGHPNGSQAAVSIAAAGSGIRRALAQWVDENSLSPAALAPGGDDFFSVLGGGDDNFFSDFALSSLEELSSSVGDESADDDFFSLLDVANEHLDRCGIDANDMMNKAIGAYFLYGPGLDLDSLANFDDFDPSSLPSLEDVAPMLLAFKDDDEEDCTAQDIAKQESASENYLQCSGVADVFDLENSDLDSELEGTLQAVGDACGPAFDILLSLEEDLSDDSFDEDSDLGKSTKKCLQSVLGDNLIGNLIRYEYQNMDKILGCTKGYSEELPRCVASAPIEGGTTISIPLSLYKKFYCLVGAASDVVVEGICTGLYEMLDEYLPGEIAAAEEREHEDTAAAVEWECVEGPCDGQFLGIDISVITGDELPSYCSKIYEDQGMDGAGLRSRFENYNVHRKHGWTVESGPTSPQANAKFPAVSSGPPARNWENGEATPETASAKTKGVFLIGGGAAFAVLALVAVAFYLKPKKAERRGYSYVSKAFGDTLI